MNILKNIREKSPLIHFITNYVTVNDVANSTLAIGASPIMTDEILDVLDMQTICNTSNISSVIIGDAPIASVEFATSFTVT